MRKLLTFFCAALMSVGMFAETPEWVLEGDTWDEGTKTLTVNSNPGYQAYRYQDSIQHVIISSGVTSIGVEAFRGCEGLTSIEIPNSVTSIGNSAFYYCTGLTSVTCVRETPASLGSGAFDDTHANLKIYVPAGSVYTYKAAWSAYAAKIVAIPPAWVRAGDEWDYATKTLTVNSDLPNSAYRGQTEIKHVIISNSVTSIGPGAFFNCTGLTSVTIPNSVTSIEYHAFAICTALKSITIPSSVTWIGTSAFGDCTSLVSVTILAERLEWYGLLTFQVTPAALKIYVPAGSVNTYKAEWYIYADKITAIPAPAPWVRDGDTWDDATKTLTVNSNLPEEAYKGQTVIEHVIISSGVTSVGNSAFYGCTGLTGELVIPNSVTSIGDGAFAACMGLTSIVVASGNTKYDSRDECNAIIETSSNKLIVGCKNTIIPNSVTSIGDYTFAVCTALTSITIPNSVISIGEGAFAGCSDLTSVTIGNSVTSIGDDAFAVCTALTSITIPNSVTSIGDDAFAACMGLTSIVVASGNTTYDSRGNCNAIIEKSSNTLIVGCKNTIIPNSVTSIGVGAFAYCTGLTSITIPNSVTSIGDYTFFGCTGLTSVTIPNSVTSIGEGAFSGCSGLTSVTCVRETPANLGNDAFNECSNLNAIYVPCGTLDAYQSSWTQYQSNIQYAQPEYTIIGNVNIEGAGTVSVPQTICDSSIIASPNYGYHFVQWSDGNTENPRTIELTQDTTFTAEFAKNAYTITTESANSEWGTAEGGTSALYLDNIQISATPNYGYHFVQWNDNNTSNPRIIQVTENKTYTATFAKNTYSITKNAVNGSIAGLSQAEYLDEVTLTATPNYGYHFVQWSDGVTENPRAFVLTQDTTFTAEFAYDRTGKCGNDLALTWTYDPEGKVLTISGNGAFEQNIQCGVEARGEMTKVIFEDGVTSIGYGAFDGCTGLTSVTIGNSVTSIGQMAFFGCSHLTSVTIGNSVTSIGDNAFQNCSGLTSITIPNSVTRIGVNAFYGCTGLSSIEIPSSVTRIGGFAFDGCTSLETVTIHAESLEHYGAYAFDGTAAALKIYVPAGSVNTYKAGWDAYKDKIVAIPEPGRNSITINESSHGSVVASSSSAVAGETITLTATPDDGYKLKSISGVYLPVPPETLNATSATVKGIKFQAQATSRNLYGWSVHSSGTANTLTVSSINGTTLITKIEFTSEWGTSRTNDMLSVSAGTLSFDGNDPSTTVTINGINATSVTISGSGTNNAETWFINSVKVYYTATIENLEISDTENANVKTFTMVDSEVTISAEFEPASTPTAVENVQTNEVQASKILRDGQILILRDGKTYTVMGAQVR